MEILTDNNTLSWRSVFEFRFALQIIDGGLCVIVMGPGAHTEG